MKKVPRPCRIPEQPIILPRHLRSDAVDFEGELAVIIGYECKNVSRARALEYVLGYTIANDVSAPRLAEKPGVARSGAEERRLILFARLDRPLPPLIAFRTRTS